MGLTWESRPYLDRAISVSWGAFRLPGDHPGRIIIPSKLLLPPLVDTPASSEALMFLLQRIRRSLGRLINAKKLKFLRLTVAVMFQLFE